MPGVLVLQHEANEPLGTIEPALRAAGLDYRFIRIQDGNPVPEETGDAAGLIILGGPMGVYEQARYPFLTDELRLSFSRPPWGLPSGWPRAKRSAGIR